MKKFKLLSRIRRIKENLPPLRGIEGVFIEGVFIEGVFLLLLFAAALIMLSCRTQYVVLPSTHTRDSCHLTTDRRMDSTFYFVHDSMSIRFGKVSSAGGNGIPDTVYVDRWHTIFKDRWHTLSLIDTITVTQHDSIPYPVEVPIEVAKPIHRFYVRCTLGFFLILLCIILYVILRIYLRR